MRTVWKTHPCVSMETVESNPPAITVSALFQQEQKKRQTESKTDGSNYFGSQSDLWVWLRLGFVHFYPQGALRLTLNIQKTEIKP